MIARLREHCQSIPAYLGRGCRPAKCSIGYNSELISRPVEACCWTWKSSTRTSRSRSTFGSPTGRASRPGAASRPTMPGTSFSPHPRTATSCRPRAGPGSSPVSAGRAQRVVLRTIPSPDAPLLGGASILFRRLPWGQTVAYVAKGTGGRLVRCRYRRARCLTMARNAAVKGRCCLAQDRAGPTP